MRCPPFPPCPPQGDFRIENCDGVYLGPDLKHNLMDTRPPLPQPQIPGDYTVEQPVNRK